ncbi:MAG: MarR family winged helix-turn-helix transcriptional regulator [Candidatus Ornithomonoglobus sp.]
MEFLDYITLVKQIYLNIEKIIDDTLKEYNLTIAQWHYIYYIYCNGGEKVHLKDIEHFFGVSQPTVVGILKRMTAKGYLYLEKADYSANSKSVTLTKTGKQVCEMGIKKKKFMDELLLNPLDDEERVVFKRSLEKIYASMQNT